jgi:hypothetical protein
VKAAGNAPPDRHKLMALLEKVTQHSPKMWGPSIVGYGSYRYTYESGRTGEVPLAGFAVRGRRKLADLDPLVLEQLVAGSVAEVRRLWVAQRHLTPVIT